MPWKVKESYKLGFPSCSGGMANFCKCCGTRTATGTAGTGTFCLSETGIEWNAIPDPGPDLDPDLT
jgi:hypothetical protein